MLELCVTCREHKGLWWGQVPPIPHLDLPRCTLSAATLHELGSKVVDTVQDAARSTLISLRLLDEGGAPFKEVTVYIP